MMKTAEHQIRVLTHPHLLEHILIKIYGECCRPRSKGGKPREQGPAWPSHMFGNSTSPCNDFPDIQDPKAPFRPLALPIKEKRGHYITFSIKH